MRLSKSRFTAGLQCHKRLYLQVHQPELAAQPDESRQARFEQGTEVDRVARGLFPEGVLVEAEYTEMNKALAQTSRLVADGKAPAVFEATFDHQMVLVRVDVLQRLAKGKRWKLIEVKSSTTMKDYYVPDIAIQRFVLEGLGFSVIPCLMLLNHEYVYDGLVHDLNKLFKIEDVTAETDNVIKGLPAEVRAQLQMLSRDVAPDIEPGPQCSNPFECEFYDICNKPVPGDHVSRLPRIAESKLRQLADLGVSAIVDIPTGFPLTKMQLHALASAVSGKTWFSKELGKKLKELKYPLYFMDFETFAPAIPRFVGMSPFGKIPFQWSVHVQRKDRTELEHYEFLAEDAGDPRLAFLQSLIRVLGGAGHIVVYHQPFESGVLATLAYCFPEYKSAINGLQRRLWDLLPVIRSHTYHIDYQGSFSLKDVLPALVPEMTYKHMEVAEGIEAGLAWDRMIHGQVDEAEKRRLRTALLAYCKQDTLAMVKLLEVLSRHSA
jgi:hypothetical protein